MLHSWVETSVPVHTHRCCSAPDCARPFPDKPATNYKNGFSFSRVLRTKAVWTVPRLCLPCCVRLRRLQEEGTTAARETLDQFHEAWKTRHDVVDLERLRVRFPASDKRGQVWCVYTRKRGQHVWYLAEARRAGKRASAIIERVYEEHPELLTDLALSLIHI